MEPTRKLPLFLVTGASCVGKSTMCQFLFQKEEHYLVLESDILWEERYNTPEDNYAAYRSLWMKLCANVAQGGKPVVLCGCCIPEQFETRPERRYFSTLHYLALTCDEKVLRKRMVEGRKVTDSAWIQSSVEFNRWLQENGGKTEPPIQLVDTTERTPEQTAEIAHQWILRNLKKDAG